MDCLHRCPACGREFKGIADYPRVRTLEFERLPIPEPVDSWSDAAAERRLARLRAERSRPDAPPDGLPEQPHREEGISMTPLVATAVNTSAVQDYLARLTALVGREVGPRDLLPPLAAHGRFTWAYPVAETGIYLSLSDSEVRADVARVAEVRVHCDGPNLGSAGGPTLQPLGAIARLRYQGLPAS